MYKAVWVSSHLEGGKQWKATGHSACVVKGFMLSVEIQAALSELEKDGYEVIAITPVISGAWQGDHKTEVIGSKASPYSGGWGWGYGYGYSVTEGVIITAKK